MKYWLLIFIFTILLVDGENAVTYNLAGGRIGDQLVGYMHAKWISHKYKLPLLCKSFPYYEQLRLGSQEIRYTDSIAKKFRIHKTLKIGQSLDDFIKDSDKNTLYIIPYFPESHEEYLPINNVTCPVTCWKRPLNQFVRFEVDWNNNEYRELLKALISPKQKLNLIDVKPSKINVAVHVRKNSNGFDLPLLHGLKKFNKKQIYVDVVFPLKHPPEEYYIDQLKKLPQIFPKKQFFVFIFTDDKEPFSILNRFKNAISCDQFEFSCRDVDNNHYSNVLEDLFSMTKFDALIRPDSNISIVASKLGNFKLIVSPKHHHWEYTNLIIDQVDMELNK